MFFNLFLFIYEYLIEVLKKIDFLSIKLLDVKIGFKAIQAFVLLFSIKITEETMSYTQLLPSFQSYLSSLDHLLLTYKQNPNEATVTTNLSKFRGYIQKYSDIDARKILCRLFERNKINVPKKNWKIEQTNLLCFIVERYQSAHGITNEELTEQDWKKISDCIPHREPSACRFRYLSLTSPNLAQQPWSQTGSQTLFRLVQVFQKASINWKQISQKLYDICEQKIYRTGKQCREHYTCFLRPNLKKGHWTSDQDYVMICLFLKYGKKWSKMAKFIQGRNQNSIKNRFFLLFENKAKNKLTNFDLIKLAKRKKERLEKSRRNSTLQTFLQVRESFVEMPQQRLQSYSQSPVDSQSQQQVQQKSQNESQSPHKQKINIEVEQKCQLEFTEDFQKYIDL